MSESWRRKAYYNKRVLIETARVLSPQGEDALLCITGAQLEMLCNLTQYLRRRSTYASEYANDYYLAPTEAEWDSILAIVADLEETLMGCDAITDALELMAAQLACICQALQGQLANTQPVDPGYTDQPYYDEYVSPVVPDEGDPPSGFATWQDWHDYVCVGSQKVVDDAIKAVLEMGTKLTTGILITFSVINAALLLTVIAAPVSMIIQVVTTLVAIGVNFAYEDVAAWLADNKELLVCAIFGATSAGAAHSAVQAAIAENWDAGLGIQVVQALFSRQTISAIFDGTLRDEDAWIAGYTSAYCEPCGEFPEGYTFLEQWPPCPADTFTDGGVCWDGRLCFNSSTTGNATQKVIVSLETFNRLDWTVKFESHFGSGWTVGYSKLDRWNPNTLEWDAIATLTCSTTVDAGQQNVVSDGFDLSTQDGGLYRFTLMGQAAQPQTEPYPFEVEYHECTFSLT